MATGGGVFNCFREIIERQNYADSSAGWKEIVVKGDDNSTGNRSAKYVDAAGGYAYQKSNKINSSARNRFIYWRTSENIVELCEISFDLKLTENCLRIRFQDVPIISGVQIYEFKDKVLVLACTVNGVYRFVFPHPDKLHGQDIYLNSPEKNVASIFTNASISNILGSTNSYQFSSSGVQHQFIVASAFQSPDGESIFALSTSSGGILIAKLPPIGSSGSSIVLHEIKQAGVMSRLWGGLVPSVIRGSNEATDTATSLCIHQAVNGGAIVFAVCRDNKLKMWSANTYELLGVENLLDHVPVNDDRSGKISIGSGHIIKKFVGFGDGGKKLVLLGVFLSFVNNPQFVVYQFAQNGSKCSLQHVTTLFGVEEDLVDFVVTPRFLWTLWTNQDRVSTVRFASVMTDRQSRKEWTDVIMAPGVKSQLDVQPTLDPREAFIDYMFHPGRFSTSLILKALAIYQKTNETIQSEELIPRNVLKAEVCEAVEAEIRLVASDTEYEMQEEDYVQLQLDQWSRFYSCCVQYYDRGSKSLGMFTDERTGLAVVVKQASIGYLRPCQVLEQIYLTNLSPSVEEFARDYPDSDFDNRLCHDINNIGECLKILSDTMDDESSFCFEQNIFHLANPTELAHNHIKMLLNEPRRKVMDELDSNLQYVNDLAKTLLQLTELLDIAAIPQISPDVDNEEEMEVSKMYGLKHLYASNEGINALCENLRQIAQSRLEISRDLLILTTYAARFASQAGHYSSIELSCLTNRLSYLVRVYYLLKWSSHTPAIPVDSGCLENTKKQLEILSLLNTGCQNYAHKLGDQSMTLIELFLRCEGRVRLLELLGNVLEDLDTCRFWYQVLPTMVTISMQMIWPTIAGFVFPQSLVGQCQHLSVQEYVRMTNNWCDFDKSSRLFVLGQSYLGCNEPYKAYDCFLDAGKNVTEDEFLISLLSRSAQDPKHIEVVYYLKVLNLFEEFELPHLVVQLSKLAVELAEDDDPNIPTLWMKRFRNELELGHYTSAYNALFDNPDPGRRKDCLRQFLSILCERNELSTLISLPYRNNEVMMEPEVVSILESRARSVDLTKHNYYELLYAFHIKRNNYRLAGSMMYECGMRLGLEVPGIDGLVQQANCYLACLNALQLGDPKYAWIVKPVALTPGNVKPNKATEPTIKRTHDGEEILSRTKRKIELLELSDIKKELLLVNSHLKLHRHLEKTPKSSYTVKPALRPDETVGLLVNAGMYDSAVEVSKVFKLPLTAVFDSLTVRCINLSKNSLTFMEGSNEYVRQAWDWLQQNEFLPASVSRDSVSAADHGWRLLQSFLERYEDVGTRYHKQCAIKMFHHSFVLPSWFISSYKKRNAAELLRLYLDFDQLEEAAELAIEYIEAVSGKGKDLFGLNDYLHAGCEPVWLPYTVLDKLLAALRDVRSDKFYKQLHEQLDETLQRHFKLVDRATQACLYKR